MLNSQGGAAEQRRVSRRGVGEGVLDFATRGQYFLKKPCDWIIRTADELLAVSDEPIPD